MAGRCGRRGRAWLSGNRIACVQPGWPAASLCRQVRKTLGNGRRRRLRTEIYGDQSTLLQPRRQALGILGEARSEEHTSELQSHLNLVCRLLLEKKKNH